MDEEKEPERKSAIQLDSFTVSGKLKNNNEKDALYGDKKRRVSIGTAATLRIATLVLSCLTVFILTVLGIFTLVVAVMDHSSSSFAFALTALLDCLSSCVVIWRYASASTLYSSAKERAACIALGILFLISGVSVIIRASLALESDDEPATSAVIWYLALVNSVACLFLFISKMYLAYKLESISIATDAMNSLIGFLLAVATLAGDLVYQRHHAIWYVDPVLGICCSSFFFVYGTWLLVYQLKQPKQEIQYESME